MNIFYGVEIFKNGIRINNFSHQIIKKTHNSSCIQFNWHFNKKYKIIESLERCHRILSKRVLIYDSD